MIDWILRWKWWWFGLIAAAALAIWLDRRWFTIEHSHDRYILAAAAKYGMEPALVKAVVWRESRFDPNAQGTKGEIGLMQIGELAAREWAEAEGLNGFRHQDLFDPAKNTLAGTWYLRRVLRRYGHTDYPFAYALADYNAGRTHVLRWTKGEASTNSQAFLEQMDYPGTRHYVLSILRRYPRYQLEFTTN